MNNCVNMKFGNCFEYALVYNQIDSPQLYLYVYTRVDEALACQYAGCTRSRAGSIKYHSKSSWDDCICHFMLRRSMMPVPAPRTNTLGCITYR